ncbi:MAG: HEPN domain-containing protein [Planctomycetes bacterium]|nr:HEPN domain-containing protein [Planctomycetota bacterium]
MSAVQEAIGEARGTIGIPPEVRRVVDAVVERYHPERVILYGSRARGDAKPDSDWDMLVIAASGALRDEIERHPVSRSAGDGRVHLVAKTREWMRRWTAERSNFARHLQRDGILLYDARLGHVYERLGPHMSALGWTFSERREGDPMKASTVDLATRAEADWKVANLCVSAPDPDLVNDVCFHCQQCVEKYVKALLNEYDVVFEKTHDLEPLFDLVARSVSTTALATVAPDFEKFKMYAVAARYTEVHVTREDADLAVRAAGAVRGVVRALLKLDAADGDPSDESPVVNKP